MKKVSIQVEDNGLYSIIQDELYLECIEGNKKWVNNLTNDCLFQFIECLRLLREIEYEKLPKQKIIINKSYGAMCLSDEALSLYRVLGGEEKYIRYNKYYDKYSFDVHSNREYPIMIEVIEQLQEKAWTNNSAFCVVEIPFGIEWVIKEYDCNEWVAEKHMVWNGGKEHYDKVKAKKLEMGN